MLIASLLVIFLFLFLRSTTYLGWLQTRPNSQARTEMASFLIDGCLKLADSLIGPGKA